METIAVVGLGYVGLPLAVEFGKKFPTIGYDLSADKIESYRRCVDPAGEIVGEDLRTACQLTVTTDPVALSSATCFIIGVPTPVNETHLPGRQEIWADQCHQDDLGRYGRDCGQSRRTLRINSCCWSPSSFGDGLAR